MKYDTGDALDSLLKRRFIMADVKKIPEGYQSVTPSFSFKDSLKALEFYKKAFSAKILEVFPNLNGPGIMHAVMEIGNSRMMMGDEMPNQSCKSAESLGASPISLFLYVEDCDATFKQAVEAGCKVTMPLMDMFWGDRAGNVQDPFGYTWMIATHTHDYSKEEIRKNAEAFFVEWQKKNGQ